MKEFQKEILLHYKGVILYDTIGDLISELKENMFEQHVKPAIFKKVLMVMIEALENVFKYNEYFAAETDIIEKYPPEISIEKFETYYSIKISNPIREADAVILKENIEEINSLDKQGVKEKYKKIITNGRFSDKGGAGLGLIEIAKITDKKLEYRFSRIDDKFLYYQLLLKIYYTP